MLRTTIALAFAAAVALPVTAQAQQRISIPTVTPSIMSALIQHKAPNATVWGDLYLPKGNGPFPAMILKHGSGGLQGATGDNVRKWAATFTSWGIAAFVVDSFGPRGIKDTASDQGQLSSWADIADSLAALKTLAADPRIDPKRIGNIGWSRGGTAVFQTALESVRASVIEGDLKFALHIAFYGAASTQYRDRATDKSPFLFLHGEVDDYTAIAATREFAEWLKTTGSPVEFIGYPKAYHDFDVTGIPLMVANSVEVGAKCDSVIDIPSGQTIRMDHKDVKGVGIDALRAYFKSCASKGAHLGHNAEARADAVEKVRAFVNKHFGLPG